MTKDLFSKQASLYAKHRPGYPLQLIEWVLAYVDKRDMAWDCATGSGQAAFLLSPYFKKIIATDISENQMKHAIQDPAISYLTCPAEKTAFADSVFDLITVAQAYHWFNFDAFYREATRVAKPGAVVAVWGYELLTTPDKALNDLILHFYTDDMSRYWDPERKYVDEAYRTIPFHFTELPSKKFHTDVQWEREDLTGFFNSWSSVQHFIRMNNYNPVDAIATKLKMVWNDGSKKKFSFPLFVRIGKIEK